MVATFITQYKYKTNIDENDHFVDKIPLYIPTRNKCNDTATWKGTMKYCMKHSQ